jgi:hypothetical protein
MHLELKESDGDSKMLRSEEEVKKDPLMFFSPSQKKG